MMKEAEVDALAMPWANARVVHLLSVHRMTTMEVGYGLKEKLDPDGYDQLMYTQNMETTEPLLLPHCTSEGRKGLYWRMYQCYGTSLAN